MFNDNVKLLIMFNKNRYIEGKQIGVCHVFPDTGCMANLRSYMPKTYYFFALSLTVSVDCRYADIIGHRFIFYTAR